MMAGDLCGRAHVEGEDQMELAHSISCSVAWGTLPTRLAATYFIVWGLQWHVYGTRFPVFWGLWVPTLF